MTTPTDRDRETLQTTRSRLATNTTMLNQDAGRLKYSGDVKALHSLIALYQRHLEDVEQYCGTLEKFLELDES